MPGNIPLEVAVFSGHSALTAQRLGASRVELNAPGSYSVGGLTPPVTEFLGVASDLQVAVRIMIRPVGAPLTPDADDFMYSAEQFAAMRDSIVEFRELNLMNPVRGDGFVFGIVRPAPNEHRIDDPRARIAVDVDRCRELIELAKPFPCVFHRAFDPIADTKAMNRGLDDLVRCGFEGLLTAGGIGDHSLHLPNLGAMIHHTKGRLQLIVGGGVRSHNVEGAAAALGVHEENAVLLHTAALAGHPDTGAHEDEHIDPEELVALLSWLEITPPD